MHNSSAIFLHLLFHFLLQHFDLASQTLISQLSSLHPASLCFAKQFEPAGIHIALDGALVGEDVLVVVGLVVGVTGLSTVEPISPTAAFLKVT